MANRSYLYSTNLPPGPDAVDQGRKLVGISEYSHDIPIVFKLLLSGHPRACPSSIWDSEGNIALIGDYDTGVANLQAFFAKVTQTAAQPLIANALEFLHKPENRNPYFVLECGEIFEMSDASISQQNLDVLAQIQNIQPEIDAALQSLQPTTTPEPAPAPKSAGFWARLLGLAPSQAHAQPPADPMQPIHALGLGRWSNSLYFDFSQDPSDKP